MIIILLLDDSEKYVGVQTSFMSLVDHNDTVSTQQRVNHCFPEKHTVRHVLDSCPLACLIVKPNQIAHLHKPKHFNCMSFA